jgi:hypothetical protein
MSEIRIEQHGVAGSDGRSVQAMGELPMAGDAIILASSSSALAMTGDLESSTRMLFIRCEGASARVSVGLAQGAKAAVETAHTIAKGVSLNEGEGRWFAIPPIWHGKDDLRVVVIDRAAVA